MVYVILNKSPLNFTSTLYNSVCAGTLPPFVNNTVVGDPFFTAPIEVSGLSPNTPVSLCYELHGRVGAIFSLINDQCTIVNAHYTRAMAGVDVNVIDAVYILAKDTSGVYRRIAMSLNNCSVSVDTAPVEREYDNDGIHLKRYTNNQPRVRVSVPNCNKTMFVMWMICENRPLPATGSTPVDMIKFVIARGNGISEFAHGLLGECNGIEIIKLSYIN